MTYVRDSSRDGRNAIDRYIGQRAFIYREMGYAEFIGTALGRFFRSGMLIQRDHDAAGICGVISTETAIELKNRQMQIDRINNVFAQEYVRNMLVRMGVDPVYASTRVDALTNEELQTLEQNLANLPAGGTGVVEVVGIVAIVLIILELLHVTDFFTEF